MLGDLFLIVSYSLKYTRIITMDIAAQMFPSTAQMLSYVYSARPTRLHHPALQMPKWASTYQHYLEWTL
jgi:hypothetical protein